MSEEIEFVSGLIFKPPSEKAPDYVFGNISIKRLELIQWLSDREGDWVNVDVKESKGGKVYCAVSNWKPDTRSGGSGGGSRGGAPQRQRQNTTRPAPVEDDFSDSIPFITSRGEW